MVISYELRLGLNTERSKRILELAHDTGALIYGEFVLASGKKSDHYFEGKRLTLSPEGACEVGMAIFEELKKTDIDAIGGLAMGAFPIITAVALVSYQQGKPIPSFIVRDQPKEHGTKRKIEGHIRKGYKVAIVDDVITTGGSVIQAVEAVEEAGCEVAKIIVIVDRHEGGSDLLEQKGYNFEAIIDLWPSGEASVSESSAITGEARAGFLRK